MSGLTNGTSYAFTVTATTPRHGCGLEPLEQRRALVDSATITSASTVTIAAGKQLNFTVTTGGTPKATVSATSVPAWMTFTPGTTKKLAGTAKLTGTGPATGDVFHVTIHANNGSGPDTTQVLTVRVLAVTSPASASFTKGTAGSFTVTTAGGVTPGTAITATLSKHLKGLTFVDNGDGTATLSGTPSSTAKTGNIQIRVTSGTVTVFQELMVTIS